MDNFLSELTNDHFVAQEDVEKIDKERLKREKEWEKEQNKQLKLNKLQEAEQKKAIKQQKDLEKAEAKRTNVDNNTLFSEKGSTLYGRDRLELLTKIQQYKVLFPNNKNLKQLKVKQNATVEELQSYISECEAIVDCDYVETFVTDSILRFGEGITMRTRFDIRGLSEMLREDPQFILLTKQLYIKYKVFSAIPCEAQMIFLITTSAYLCIQKNKQDERKQALLSKTIDPSQF